MFDFGRKRIKELEKRVKDLEARDVQQRSQPDRGLKYDSRVCKCGGLTTYPRDGNGPTVPDCMNCSKPYAIVREQTCVRFCKTAYYLTADITPRPCPCRMTTLASVKR